MRTSHSHREPIGKPAAREGANQTQLAGRLDELLTQAATLASENGLPPDAFAAAAWHAYLRASPALAEHIEQLQFAAGIEEMRNAGRLAKA